MRRDDDAARAQTAWKPRGQPSQQTISPPSPHTAQWSSFSAKARGAAATVTAAAAAAADAAALRRRCFLLTRGSAGPLGLRGRFRAPLDVGSRHRVQPLAPKRHLEQPSFMLEDREVARIATFGTTAFK